MAKISLGVGRGSQRRGTPEEGSALLLVNVSELPQYLAQELTRAFGGGALLCRYNNAGYPRSAVVWLPDHESIAARPDGESVTLMDMVTRNLGDVFGISAEMRAGYGRYLDNKLRAETLYTGCDSV